MGNGCRGRKLNFVSERQEGIGRDGGGLNNQETSFPFYKVTADFSARFYIETLEPISFFFPGEYMIALKQFNLMSPMAVIAQTNQ